MNSSERLVSKTEAAALLHMTPGEFDKCRSMPGGPAHTLTSGGAMFATGELVRWVRSHQIPVDNC